MIRTNRFASLAVTALATAGVGAAALVGAGAASATSADAAFLQDIANIGISYDTDQGAVSDGQLVCERLEAGTEPNDVLADYRAASPELTVKQAKSFIIAAASAYCPKYL